jgi:hypothetical protein
MRRREFITLVAAWPLAARAQQPTFAVVGFLRDATASRSGFLADGLRKVDFGVLAHPTYPPSALFIKDAEAAARS